MPQMNEPVISQSNESYHIWRVMAQINESCHTDSCHAYARIISYIWMCHVAHTHISFIHDMTLVCHSGVVSLAVSQCVAMCFSVLQCSVCCMSHICTHASYLTWPIHLWHDWSIYAISRKSCKAGLCIRLRMSDMIHSCVTWLIHLWHDSFIYTMSHKSCRTGVCIRLRMSDKIHSCVTWLIHVWHDSFICDMTHSSTTCLIQLCHES